MPIIFSPYVRAICTIKTTCKTITNTFFSHLFLQEHLPELYVHFQSQSFHTSMYASSWFLTIFLTTFPLPIATRIFDIFMSEVTTQYLCSASRVMVKSSYFSSTVKTVLMGKFQIPCLCRFISCLVREDVCACSLRKSKYIFEYRCCKQLYSLSLLKSHRICQKFWMPCDSIVQQGVCFSVVWGEK